MLSLQLAFMMFSRWLWGRCGPVGGALVVVFGAGGGQTWIGENETQVASGAALCLVAFIDFGSEVKSKAVVILASKAKRGAGET